MDSQRLKHLGDRAQELKKLPELRAWERLQGDTEEELKKRSDRLVRRFLSREDAAELQRDADYLAGASEFARWIFLQPSAAKVALDKAVKRSTMESE